MAQHVRLGETFRFGATVHNPSGGAIINADETPRWFVYEEANDTPIIAGDFTLRTGAVGRYRGTFAASTANGFDTQSYYEVHASGKVNGIVGFDILSSFVVDDVYNSNLIQYNSGTTSDMVDLFASGILRHIATIEEVASGVWVSDPAAFNVGFGAQLQPLYFADVKQYYDIANNRDEYSVQWFNGGVGVTSGQLTDPSLSVYHTSTGAQILANKVLTYTSPILGSTRYNSTGAEVLASGEPYLAVVSGTIGGSVRTFPKVIGRHNL
jgi:hypothetical protein